MTSFLAQLCFRVFVYDVIAHFGAPKASRPRRLTKKEERAKVALGCGKKGVLDVLEAMEDMGHDWESSSEAASPSPSIGSQASVLNSNGTKKAINRGRWTKDEVSDQNGLG